MHHIYIYINFLIYYSQTISIMSAIFRNIMYKLGDVIFFMAE